MNHSSRALNMLLVTYSRESSHIWNEPYPKQTHPQWCLLKVISPRSRFAKSFQVGNRFCLMCFLEEHITSATLVLGQNDQRFFGRLQHIGPVKYFGKDLQQCHFKSNIRKSFRSSPIVNWIQICISNTVRHNIINSPTCKYSFISMQLYVKQTNGFLSR